MDQPTVTTPGYKPMSIGDWIVTFIITYVPIVGFIMLFVWAFGGGAHPSKKSWAQATLIMFLIGIILAIIFFSVIMTMLGSFFSGMSSYS